MDGNAPDAGPPWYARPWVSQLILLAVALGLLLPGSATIPMMDRDEPRFANATWEMMERGEWFVPYFNEEYRFDKPILSYWWMRVHYWILGKTELAARLHSIVSAWLTALVIQAMGGFLFSRRAGFWAGFGWLISGQVLIHGRLCVADMPMLLGVTLTMLGVFRLMSAEQAPGRFGRWFWVTVAGLVIGFLAKGPIAVLVPLSGLLLARFAFFRGKMPWGRLQPVSLLLVSTFLVGLWGVPALLMTGGEFGREGIGKHVVERGFEAFNNRTYIPLLPYLLFGYISLAPWSAFFPGAFEKDEVNGRSMEKAILLGWFIAPYAIFAFYKTQLPHYVMPGFPAFFLLLFRHGYLPKVPSWWFWGVVGTMLTIFLGGYVFIQVGVDWPERLRGLRHFLTIAFSLLLVVGSWPILLRRRWWVPLVGSFGLTALLLIQFGQTIRSIHPVIRMQKYLEPEAGLAGETEYAAWQFTEPSLVFYTRPGWKMSGSVPELAGWLREGKNRVGVFLLRSWQLDDQWEAFVETGEFTSEPAEDRRTEVLTIINNDEFELHLVEGYNVAKSSWAEVLVARPKD